VQWDLEVVNLTGMNELAFARILIGVNPESRREGPAGAGNGEKSFGSQAS